MSRVVDDQHVDARDHSRREIEVPAERDGVARVPDVERGEGGAGSALLLGLLAADEVLTGREGCYARLVGGGISKGFFAGWK